jgi:response regulator RpfG family c-di-GMP phosphodiesterase
LVLGAFFHDVGLCELPLELQGTPLERMKAADLKRYRQHPQRGYEILRAVASLDEEVALVALQHHEHPNGGGYPAGLTRSDILPAARVVRLIDCYVEKWQQFTHEQRMQLNAASFALEWVVSRDVMGFESHDVQALRIVVSSMDLARGRRKLASLP